MRRSLWVMLAGLAACAGESLNVGLASPTVELDVFSGRPNPRWQLAPQEASELEDRLNGLPETSPIEIPNQLGYRGFTIQDKNNKRLTVTNNGYIVVHEEPGDRFYRDTKDVQLWLERQAEAHGYGNLLIKAQ